MDRVSPSRLSDFKQCPQLFKFRSIDRLLEPATIYQARGTTAHLALQRLYGLDAVERTPERLYDLFREAWAEVRDDEYPDMFETVEEERAWGIESMELLANYFSVEDPRKIAPVIRASFAVLRRRFVSFGRGMGCRSRLLRPLVSHRLLIL